ncbi:hypothetical protein PDESU_00596 [Pontiella desulfatans]|uniref:Thiazole biosynthetic enzyme n=1 Tax=Pontiella desulfatans TaxID=2750659 RepID=A0A6C2TWV4_PONDE|nr:FAD-dependent oxidoreductase [Pontiella desulfatans]VGO12047.1 hypothetical protein PDESU_00596 [Pontiella desulfatans]
MAVEVFDVAVVGAGASGVPAAVAAAREGARVALLEKTSSVGGAMCAGLGFPVCGLFLADTEEPQATNEGLASEFIQSASAKVERRGRVHLFRCGARKFAETYERWIKAESSIRLYADAGDLRVGEAEGRISRLGFGDIEIEVGAVVDCTGCAAVVRNSSALTIVPEEPALAGFLVRLRDVEFNDMLPIKVPHTLWRAVDTERLPLAARYTVFDEGVLKISVGKGASAEWLASEILRELKAELPEFQKVEIEQTSGVALQREGIRLKGKTVLSEEDVRTGRGFANSAARGCWPMEFWDAERGVRYAYVEGGGSYDIPMGALKSENIANLWAAGRAISADSMALSSARVIGTCIATGEAAGRAAAREAA